MLSRYNNKSMGRREYERGNTLLDQGNHKEAKELFQRAFRKQERVLGSDHIDTLYSKYMLGRTLQRQDMYSEAEKLLRPVVRRLEKKLGEDHEDTLKSKYWLGCTLYDLKEHKKAKKLLQQAACGLENQLGEDHMDTIKSKYWLGRTVYFLEEYSEAEEPLRQAAQGYEKNYGKGYTDTLSSKYWLGCTLYNQGKYCEAKEALQQAVQGYKENYGEHHTDTLSCKYWLGCTFYDQRKYREAEELLQSAVHGYEQNLGREDLDTLYSKYWLARSLYDQGEYSKAEELLQQVVYGYEQNLGRENVDTLYSKYWLARSLYDQGEYSKAEELLQQVVHGQEKELGNDHEGTLDSRYWLGLTLYDQKKYSEAEGTLRQAADGRERTIGRDHEDTLATIRLLQELQLYSSSFLATNNTTQQALACRLNSFFSDGQNSREPYTDSEINEISSLLKYSHPQWSNVPRTYIILRTISHLNRLDDLIDVDFSDYWFPVTERGLPSCLLPSVKALFVRAQNLVLTKSLDLEKGAKGHHCYYKQGESPPLETKAILGRGGFGQVDRVLSLISFKEYARKQVPRGLAFRGRQKEDIKRFVAEIEILKRLKHHHIVKFVGSYTDPKCISLIMSPVAEKDLAAYLKRANDSNLPELRTFFGCLATALEFLHEQNVRHKDIKPSNILVSRGRVLFADFGLSIDFTDANGSTTMSMVNGMTPRYCAPEVALQGPRNTMSDVWSLGAVFMEMIVILKGKTAQYMDEFYKQHRSWQAFVCTNPTALLDFVAELEKTGEFSDNIALGWTQQMLSPKQQLRPTASSLVTSITASDQGGESMNFCGICCVSSEEDFSDWEDE
ncbi:kinase-like domain-containing protein [Pyrenochaeta sp. MPI-SDFR-AT-0127]|nr:kinase-like domain-containing protein [Pyrenochaeta sp. MPI-SDFR-AT-0127]